MIFARPFALVLLAMPAFALASGAKAGFDAVPPGTAPRPATPPATRPASQSAPSTAPASPPAANAPPAVAPAPQATPRQMFSSVIMSFTLALGRGDYARAYSFTDQAYKAKVTLEQFTAEQAKALSAVRPLPREISHAESVTEADYARGWRFANKCDYPADVPEAARAGRAMVITDANPFVLHLVLEEGKFKVAAITHGSRDLARVTKGREMR